MSDAFDPVAAFKADLKAHDDATVLDRHFYSGPSAVLKDAQVASLRRTIAEKFKVPMRDVILVGSAKLGFTMLGKEGRPPFSAFCDESDIDIAIISERLYLHYWKSTFAYWQQSGDWTRIEPFKKYLFRGWLRPDLLPPSPDFPDRQEWWDFLLGLQTSGTYGPYRIRTGVYFDEHFWESYAKSAFQTCREIVENPL